MMNPMRVFLTDTGLHGHAPAGAEAADALERITAEEDALRQSAARLQAAVDAADLGTWDWDLVTGKIVWAGHHARLFGFDNGDFDGTYASFENRIHREDRELLRAAVEHAMRQRCEYAHEYRVVWPDGSVHWIAGRGRFMYDVTGQPSRMLGTVADITARKRAEDELTKRKELLEKILEHIPVMIAFLDPQGRAIWVNRECERLLGWTLDDVRSRDIFAEIYPDPAYRRAVREFVQSTRGKWAVFQSRAKDGRVLHTAWANVMLSDGSTIGIGQDTSDRRQAEQTIRASHDRIRRLAQQLVSVQEEERRRLSRELHDQVGRNLTALGLSLNRLRAHLGPAAGRAGPCLDDSLGLLQQTAELVRGVMADLRPPLLDDFGLEAALRWAAQQFTQRTGVRVDLSAMDAIPRLDAAVETAVFRVAQEALVNVSKHAKATEVNVIADVDERGVRLMIADNGIGFDVGRLSGSHDRPCWGLAIMAERATAGGVQCCIDSAPGAGTRVILEAPR